MNAYQTQVSNHEHHLIEQVRNICNTGNITQLDTFLCSPNGYQYGVASASSLTDGLLAIAMRSVLLHDRWAVLEHVMTRYNPRCSIMSLIHLDTPAVRRPTVDWVHKVRRILNEFILRRLPVDDAYIHQMKQMTMIYGAYSVWLGFQPVENWDAITSFLTSLTRAALEGWNVDMEFFFKFILQQSSIESVLTALHTIPNLNPRYTRCIEEELHKHKMVALLQGTHTRLGANSPIRLLDPALLRHTMEYTWPSASDP